MAGLRFPKADGTEGAATAKLTFKEGRKKLTFMIHGCIVKNDANLMTFIREHIKQPADMRKFDQKSTKYFFYACDPDFEEERNYHKVTIVCHRFSDPKNPKQCELNCSPAIFVKVQDQHIFLLCDSKSSDHDFNKSSFLRDHSKNILVAQDLTKEIYGLSCKEEDEDCPKFILLDNLNHLSSNVYRIDAKYYETLQDTGPVLLQDRKTVVGSFEKQDDGLILISIFGSNQCNSYSSESQEAVKSEQKPELARSYPEVAAGGQNGDAKLEIELSDEKKNIEEKKSTTSLEVVEGNQKQDINVSEKKSVNEEKKDAIAAGDQSPDPKLNEESEDKKIEDKTITQQKVPLEKDASRPDKQQTSKQSQEHEYKFPDSLQDQTDANQFNDNLKCKSGQQVSNGSFDGTTDPDDHEGIMHQQATTTNETSASEDQLKLTENETKDTTSVLELTTVNSRGKDILNVPVKKGQSSNYEEKSPIQETSGSPEGFDPIEKIKSTLPNRYHLHDNLGQKKNTKRYGRYLLYVAQNVTGKWQEIGERLDIKANKLQTLKADYSSDGSAEQAYQMMVHWRQSDKNPTLKKLLDALIATELVEVANQVSEMLIDSRSHDGIPVTDKLLNEITKEIKGVWKFLGRYLAIDENDIHSIKMDNLGNTREQARQMFDKWKQSNGRHATTGVLINALKDVGKSNIAQTVQLGNLIRA